MWGARRSGSTTAARPTTRKAAPSAKTIRPRGFSARLRLSLLRQSIRNNICRLPRRAGIIRNPPDIRTTTRLEAQFQKRFSGGLETLIAFTWEKCLADTNGDFNAENGSEGAPNQYYFSPRLAYGPCAFDIPKVFTATAVYQLPFGHGKKWLSHGFLSRVAGNWETNFAFLARSGEAYNPSWGGASNVCTSTVTTNCVPASIAGVAPTSYGPRQSFECGRRHNRLQPA